MKPYITIITLGVNDLEQSVKFYHEGLSFPTKGIIGKELIENLKQHLKQDGVTELWLGTATDNESGQAFFVNTGASKSNETFNEFTYKL